jgi:hypothetical protein
MKPQVRLPRQAVKLPHKVATNKAVQPESEYLTSSSSERSHRYLKGGLSAVKDGKDDLNSPEENNNECREQEKFRTCMTLNISC